MTVYIDSSAAAKLIVNEPESDALLVHLEDLADEEVYPVSSMLMETEIRRLAARHGVDQASVSEIMVRFDLVQPSHSTFAQAGYLPPTIFRSVDALHVATALEANAEIMIAYDRRLADAARGAGIRVVAPGLRSAPPG